MSDNINSLSLEKIADTLREVGFRATLATANDRPLIQSAAQGLGFIVTPGNRAADGSTAVYVDLTFSCLIQVAGSMDAADIARWNEQKRFARLYVADKTLVLAMDVFLATGDASRCLRGYCELWDRVLNEFVAWLRSLSAAAATAADATT